MNIDPSIQTRTPNNQPSRNPYFRRRLIAGGLAVAVVLVLGEGVRLYDRLMSPSAEALSVPTEQSISDGQGLVDTGAEVKFGPGTSFYSSPNVQSEAGGGGSNLVYQVPAGKSVQVKGLVAGINPETESGGYYEAVSLTVPGQISPSILWTPFSGGAQSGNGNPASPGITFTGNEIIANGGPEGNFVTAQGSIVSNNHTGTERG